MTHILTNGLDTHDVHITFMPDLLLVTTVSFWGIHLTMQQEVVDENLQGFGEGSYDEELRWSPNKDRSPHLANPTQMTNSKVHKNWRKVHQFHVHRTRKTINCGESPQTKT